MKRWTTYSPERDDRGVVRVEYPAVLRIALQIVQIHRRVSAPNEDLELLLIEHPTTTRETISQPQVVDVHQDELKPLVVDYLRQTLEERVALLLDLLAQAVVRNEVDVLEPVLLRHRNVAAVGDEIHCLCDAEICFHSSHYDRCPSKKYTATHLRRRQ